MTWPKTWASPTSSRTEAARRQCRKRKKAAYMAGGGPLTALRLGSYTGPCRSRTHGQENETGNAIAVRQRSGRRGCAPGCAPIRRGAPGQIRRRWPVDPHLPPPGRRSGAAHGRVPYHGPALREVDPALQPVQVRRTYRRQGGHPHVLRGVRGLPPRREPARRRRLLGLFRGKILCNTTRRRRHWRPRLHDPAAGSGFRITSPRIGIPESAASPPRPSGTPPWTGCTWLPPSEAIPALC